MFGAAQVKSFGDHENGPASPGAPVGGVPSGVQSDLQKVPENGASQAQVAEKDHRGRGDL